MTRKWLLICLVLVLGFVAIVFVVYGKPFDETWDTQIVSLRNSNEAGGTFFLGAGVTEGHEYYYFYKTLPNGGFQLSKIFSGETTIFEEKRNDGVMRVSYNGGRRVDIRGYGIGFGPQVVVSFHIPTGSIQRHFVLH